jgi:ribosomal protein S18 acetylase RimI-like enzyme
MLKIVHADTPQLVEHIVAVAQDYVTWMLAEIRQQFPALDVELFATAHDYDDVRKKIPGTNIPPHGCMLLALADEQVCGCIALGKLTDTIGEMRTLYVRPQYRGLGTGKRLVKALIEESRRIGYTHLRLDTLRFMEGAYRLYQSFGFYEIEPYGAVPDMLKPYIRFLEADITPR